MQLSIRSTVCGYSERWSAGCLPSSSGVDDNPMTMFYSVYLGLWSITFLNWWTRRENELRFLWGNEQHQAIAAQAEPRHQFKGVLEINPDTGRQMLVARSEFGQSLKRLIGFFAVFFMMIVTNLSIILVLQGKDMLWSAKIKNLKRK